MIADRTTSRAHSGYSLMELVGAVAILAIVAMLAISRTAKHHDDAAYAICEVQVGQIETAIELWRHETGTWPNTTLSDIAADVDYFPQGIPTCPVDGTAYTIDSSGRILGHPH